MARVQSIDLERLHEGVCSYSPRKCEFAYEAAVYCLHIMGHESGVICRIHGALEESRTVEIVWSSELPNNVSASWDDEYELVEEGATAIALALIDKFTDYDDVRRAPRGRGVDFYMGYKDSIRTKAGFRVFSARLEVSGILAAGSDRVVKQRVRRKQNQTRKSDMDNNPAHVIVAEFSQPMVDWSKRTP